MEVAAYFCTGDKAESVTVVGNQSVPFETVLGKKVGARIQKMFEESSKKVQFVMNCPGVQEFLSSSEKSSNLSIDEAVLGRVVLANGESLVADVCVVGIGVEPVTGFLANSGVDMDPRGFIFVDKVRAIL
jgi:pyruvate/2-oxoglutarate dehydrogenase complex dihydrolipoamide dehydrogenase (E3) component